MSARYQENVAVVSKYFKDHL